MTTHRFQEVKRTAKRRVECFGGCGKKLARQTTFMQTINPFNTNAEGNPKSYAEIMTELTAKADAWSPVALCPACSADPEVRGAAIVANGGFNV